MSDLHTYLVVSVADVTPLKLAQNPHVLVRLTDEQIAYIRAMKEER